jgi:hypothetical protein
MYGLKASYLALVLEALARIWKFSKASPMWMIALSDKALKLCSGV